MSYLSDRFQVAGQICGLKDEGKFGGAECFSRDQAFEANAVMA
jgi:hypothetical protein